MEIDWENIDDPIYDMAIELLELFGII